MASSFNRVPDSLPSSHKCSTAQACLRKILHTIATCPISSENNLGDVNASSGIDVALRLSSPGSFDAELFTGESGLTIEKSSENMQERAEEGSVISNGDGAQRLEGDLEQSKASESGDSEDRPERSKFDGFLGLLVEAARWVSGGFGDGDGSESEGQSHRGRKLISRPLRVRPWPSKTDVASIFRLRARYTCGGTISEPPSSSESPCIDSTDPTRYILLQSGTFNGAEDAMFMFRRPPRDVASSFPRNWWTIPGDVETGSSKARDSPPARRLRVPLGISKRLVPPPLPLAELGLHSLRESSASMSSWLCVRSPGSSSPGQTSSSPNSVTSEPLML